MRGQWRSKERQISAQTGGIPYEAGLNQSGNWRNAMSTTSKRGYALLVVAALTMMATPVLAAGPVGFITASRLTLPPLPEWPVIGPLLVRLGVVEEAVEPAPVPDPTIPEVRITTFDDLRQLEAVAAGERVRVISTEVDVNRIAQELLAQQAGERATFRVEFAPQVAVLDATVDASLVERFGVDLPGIVRGSLEGHAALGADAANCLPVIDIERLKVNGWSIGLSAIAQRIVDDRTAEVWPAEICVERILLMDGEAAVEGYRVP